MPTAERSRPLVDAARRRSQAAHDRAVDALRRLDRSAEPLSFRAVAEAASVSRSWLYRHPALRAEIDRRRAAGQAMSPPPRLAALRASEASRRAQLDALRAELGRLADENRQLRHQVERLLGEQRAARSLPAQHP